MLQCISTVLLLCAAAYAQNNNSSIMIGEISTKSYEVSGTLYAIDEETLFIKDFNYNGKGPDALFYIGTKDEKPSNLGQLIRYPQEQDKCDGETKVLGDDNEQDGEPKVLGDENEQDGEPKILGAYNKQDITLRLPQGFKISTELKWFSVWCRQYEINFGHVIVPRNLQIPKAQHSDGMSTCPGDSGSDILSHIDFYRTLILALSTTLYFLLT